MLKVTLVVLNWNGILDTLECLESIRKLNKKGIDLSTIVVDNGSTNNSVEILKSIKDIALIRNDHNLGFAEGNNVGIKHALSQKSDYIVVLNNDVYLERNSILELVKLMERDTNIGAVSPKIYFAKGFEYKKTYKKSDLGKVVWYAGGKIDWDNVYGSGFGVDEVDHGQFEQTRETDFATGTCMIMRKSVIKKVGMFDNKYFLYFEDTDLSQRVKKAGYKVMVHPKSIIWHKVSRGSGIGSELNDYYLTRNRMLFGMKYARSRTKIALIRESLRLLINGRTWQKVGVRDFYLEKFGKGSWK